MNAPTHMLPVDLQTTNEYHYSRAHMDKWVAKAIDNELMQAKTQTGVMLLKKWLAGSYYASKTARLAQLQVEGFDLEAMVKSIFVGIAYYGRPETFVSVTAQMAGKLGFNDKLAGITTMAEILAVLVDTGTFLIYKEDALASLMLVSRIQLPDELRDAAERSMYILPMVCAPKPVKSNWESAYLTFNDSLVLGKGNSHDGDLCLDVINTQNQIAMSLDEEFLDTVEEVPNKPITNMEQKLQWDHFKLQSIKVYCLLLRQGNQFHLTNKVDKRGRLYAQGYHVSSQGSSYKKAMLELAHKEVINGVPGL